MLLESEDHTDALRQILPESLRIVDDSQAHIFFVFSSHAVPLPFATAKRYIAATLPARDNIKPMVIEGSDVLGGIVKIIELASGISHS